MPNLLPVVLVAALAALALTWNAFVGLQWSVGLLPLAAPSLVCFAVAWVYSTVRPNPAVAEGTLYAGLWLIYPTFGIQLTYLASLLGFPFQDRLFASADAAMGFQWIDWAHFVSTHPAVEMPLRLAYESHYWQPLISIAVFTFWRQKNRNAELLTAMLLALVVTTIISAFLPAMGPADTDGFPLAFADVVRALRGGAHSGLAYAGIITFPSFHTVMAILFTLAHRGNRWTFWPVLVLNIMMLISIPFAGTHYLSDMMGGAVVAVASFFVTARFYRSGQPVYSGIPAWIGLIVRA